MRARPEFVTPFRVAIPDAAIDDLHARLNRTRWPAPSARAPWSDGVDLAFLQKLATHWRQSFDWRAQERLLNAWPQFLVGADGLRLHCSVTGSGTRPPLLLLTGWPSSYFEHHKIIASLTERFDVVCASLPGIAFSESVAGMNTSIAAHHFVRMMEALGHTRFAVHATDFGALVAAAMALHFPECVAALHFAAVPPATSRGDKSTFTLATFPEEMGYFALQSTRPQTLSYALADSPVALAAWIVEKWRAWSDCGGDVLTRFSMDELLTTISLYWFTGCGGSAANLYYEHVRAPLPPGSRIAPPAGFSVFPHPPQRSRGWAERVYNVAYWNEMPRGGHFPAMEEPELLTSEITRFLEQQRYI